MDKIDFHCHKCGKECPIAPDPPRKAICKNCCEEHDYEYDRSRRGSFCNHCDKQLIENDYYYEPYYP